MHFVPTLCVVIDDVHLCFDIGRRVRHLPERTAGGRVREKERRQEGGAARREERERTHARAPERYRERETETRHRPDDMTPPNARTHTGGQYRLQTAIMHNSRTRPLAQQRAWARARRGRKGSERVVQRARRREAPAVRRHRASLVAGGEDYLARVLSQQLEGLAHVHDDERPIRRAVP